MALVDVTGNVWDHARRPLSSTLLPRLWFAPVKPTTLAGLMTGAEVPATLDSVSGAFSVRLEADGVYQPRLDWVAPGQETEPPERRARGYEEWPFTFSPGPGGGPIDQLPSTAVEPERVWVGLTVPAGFRGWWLQAGPGDPDNPAESGTGELRKVY